MTLEIQRHTGKLELLTSDWERILDSSHPGAPFRSPAWVLAWARHPPSDIEPYVLVARSSGRIVAILPLYSESTFFGGRRLRLMGDDIVGSDYIGIVAQPEQQASAADAFAAFLAQQPFEELFLDGLACGDPLARPFFEWSSLEITPRFRCPTIAFDGDFDCYLDGLPDGTGHQWRRRLRWLERQPGFRFEVLQRPDELRRGLDLLIALHLARWSDGSAAIDGERTARFHRDALDGLARLGWARIFVLFVDGAPRAALYGFEHGDRFAFYQAGRDPAWQRRAVGTVLLGLAIRSCSTAQLREFDFLHGDESYKLRWATAWRETVALRVRGRGVRAYLGCQAGATWRTCRELAKGWLPPNAVDGLRRLVHAWAR